jgi:copper chaperone CopZ
MEKMILTVPKMWADHHVLTVREALTALDGVQDVYASAAWRQVVVNYDPAVLDEAGVVAVLEGVGYGTDGALELEGQPLAAGDPQWDELGVRVTKTNERDRELSGDFRRY